MTAKMVKENFIDVLMRKPKDELTLAELVYILEHRVSTLEKKVIYLSELIDRVVNPEKYPDIRY